MKNIITRRLKKYVAAQITFLQKISVWKNLRDRVI